MKALVFYLETGHGFKSPALAIARELADAGVEVQPVDFYKAIGALGTDNFVVEGWKFCLRFPPFFKFVFLLADSPLLWLGYAWQFPLIRKRLDAYLDRERPDFIVSTHFLSTHILARHLAKRAGPKPPCFGYNSDVILSHNAYVDPDVTMYYVSTAMGRDAMAAQGMPPERLALVGFPIDPKYRKTFGSVAEERARLGLKDIFTLLVTYGGEGIGDLTVVRELATRRLPLQMVVVCGKNEALKARLEALAASVPGLDMKVLGFVSNMQDYLYCCDISAGKSGLNVAFESIYMKRPLLVLTAMANEVFCAKFMRDQGYGWYPKGSAEAIAIVEDSLAGRGDMDRIRRRLEVRPCGFGIGDMVESMVGLAKAAPKKSLAGAGALLFDLAGTLCDIPIGDKWEQVNHDGIAAVLDELGFTAAFSAADRETLAARFVEEKKRLRKDAKVTFREYEVKEQLRGFFAELAAEGGANGAWFKALAPDEPAWLRAETRFVEPELAITIPFPEAGPVLDRLAKDYPLYLLSNNVSRVLVEGILAKCGLEGRFKAVFVSSDIGFRKPHRKFIDAVIAGTGLEPGACVMIGDRLGQDIKMAQDFGMLSVYAAMVEHEDNEGVEGVRWNAKIGALGELVELLGK
jgi:HAD superfamily hydrolase (TIGR01549 family)